MFKIIIMIVIVLIETRSENVELRIGGLFHSIEDEIAFRIAANIVNRQNAMSRYRFIPHTAKIQFHNTFNVLQQACSLLQKGVIAIFGPGSPHASSYMTTIFDSKEMPQIEIHCDPNLTRKNCLLNLHPHPTVMAKALANLFDAYDWKQITILYQGEESWSRIGPILDLYANHGGIIKLKQLEKGNDGSFRDSLLDIKINGGTHIMLDCSVDVLVVVLQQLQQVGMMTEYYHYIITNLDLQTIDLTQYQYGGSNITGLSLVNLEDNTVIQTMKKIYKTKIENGINIESNTVMRLHSALIIDGVTLLYQAVMDYTNKGNFNFRAKPLHCNKTDNLKSGYSLINYMKGKTINGLTGMVQFDLEGFRRDFTLNIIELTPKGLSKVGNWDSNKGLNIKNRLMLKNNGKTDEGSLVNKTLRVITCLTPPYAMLKEETVQLSGNDRFEGFGIDLIYELSNMLGFNYTFEIQENGTNGNQDPVTKEWNGLIGEIVKKKADLAIGDLTVTSDREEYVDFTPQFMSLGIKILYKKPKPAPPSLFLFVSPFSTGVWLLLGLAFLFVSLALFIMGRLSPSEWTNPYPCIEEPEYFINQFSIRNSFWFTVGSLMQQGSDIAPIGISTRTAAGVWWFFILIMVSSYTANLAAFLTVETPVTSFDSLEELAAQTEIKYGAKRDGATANYFKFAERGTIRHKIWRFMSSHDDLMPQDNNEGVRRVENENYAFFMESTSIDYVTERHCDLASVGKPLDEKGYAIAMEKGSPYRNDLSTAVLRLQETGKISEIQEKWWKEKCGAGRCEKKEQSEAKPLSLKNAGGVFLVLFLGSVIGFITSLFELAWHVHKRSQARKTSFKEELKKELRFFMEFKQNIKVIEEIEFSTDVAL